MNSLVSTTPFWLVLLILNMIKLDKTIIEIFADVNFVIFFFGA